ncbi:restriction endonuclease subunit S [Vibrio parahaemolyticus]|uniref:restriction endonuclease subunit S n=1 Tax=Vibrio parahaemolyticus TaxID=670 RepID=UPI00320C4FAE
MKSNALSFIRLGDIADFRNGLNFSKESHGKGCPLIGVGDFKDNFSPKWDELEEINPDGVSKVEDYLKEGDLLFVRSNGNKALVGRSLYINKDIKALYSGFCIRARLKTDDICPLFLAYFTKTQFFRDAISFVAGTNINNLNQGILSEVRIPSYSKEKQALIVKSLSSIDKKIELNNRINAELEAMAKTLYDYWFVQFDFPDANGDPYKASGGKMVYNPVLKREIPEGWVAKPLSKITSVSKQTVKPTDYPDKVFRHFSIPVYDATKTYGLEAGGTIGSNKFTNKESDILVSKLNPWFSRVIYAMEEKELICSTEFVVWRTSSSGIKNYLYMVAQSPQFITHCTQAATGTSNSHKRVNPSVMMGFELPFNDDVAISLGEKLEPMIKQKIINQRENTELAKLRDWLLPMLMNGQVTVKPSTESQEAQHG